MTYREPGFGNLNHRTFQQMRRRSHRLRWTRWTCNCFAMQFSHVQIQLVVHLMGIGRCAARSFVHLIPCIRTAFPRYFAWCVCGHRANIANQITNIHFSHVHPQRALLFIRFPNTWKALVFAIAFDFVYLLVLVYLHRSPFLPLPHDAILGPVFIVSSIE